MNIGGFIGGGVMNNDDVVPTVVMQSQSPTLMVNSRCDTKLTVPSAANNVNDDSQNDRNLVSIRPNHPRLLTRLALAKLKLSFLRRCQNLKRPPTSLRLRENKCIKLKAFITCASTAETNILDCAIKEKRCEIDKIRQCISSSDSDNRK